jgi:hypothetical protein
VECFLPEAAAMTASSASCLITGIRDGLIITGDASYTFSLYCRVASDLHTLTGSFEADF